jgi:hypothetical protein
MASADEFRKTLETSLKIFKVSYVDLCAFPGLHGDELGWAFDGEDNCHAVGPRSSRKQKDPAYEFSTHASTDLFSSASRRTSLAPSTLPLLGATLRQVVATTALGNMDCIKLLEKGMVSSLSVLMTRVAGCTHPHSYAHDSPQFEPGRFDHWLEPPSFLEGEGAFPSSTPLR